MICLEYVQNETVGTLALELMSCLKEACVCDGLCMQR